MMRIVKEGKVKRNIIHLLLSQNFSSPEGSPLGAFIWEWREKIGFHWNGILPGMLSDYDPFPAIYRCIDMEMLGADEGKERVRDDGQMDEIVHFLVG